MDDTGGKKKKKKGGKAKIIVALLIVLLAIAAGVGVAMMQGPLAAKVIVPSVTGMTQDEAQAELEKYNLEIGTVTYNTSDTVEKDKIMSQDPAANDAVDKDTKVNVVISQGKGDTKTARVPNLVGLSASEAERLLAAEGLVGDSSSGTSDSYDAGLVFEQDPSPLTMVVPGSTVKYTISAGESNKPVKVPTVRGLSEEDATNTLEELGFTVKTRTGKSNEVGEGEVYDQSIASGTEVTKGTTITIYIATGSSSSGSNSGSGSDSDSSSYSGSGSGSDSSSGSGSSSDSDYDSSTDYSDDSDYTGSDYDSSSDSSDNESSSTRSSDYE